MRTLKQPLGFTIGAVVINHQTQDIKRNPADDI
jgi:hypothetical protein